MKKETWAWIVGGVLFAGIIGIWAWQLPKVLSRVASGQDKGLSAIISAMSGSKSSLTGDLQAAQDKFEANMKNFSQAMQTPAVQASAIDTLKKKIESRSSADAPAASLPVTDGKAPVKK